MRCAVPSSTAAFTDLSRLAATGRFGCRPSMATVGPALADNGEPAPLNGGERRGCHAGLHLAGRYRPAPADLITTALGPVRPAVVYADRDPLPDRERGGGGDGG